MKDSQLIFLISQPRSGSTLLQKMLGSHSKIYTRSEPWIMLYPAYSLKSDGIKAEYEFVLGQIGLEDFCSGLPEGKKTYISEIRKMQLSLYEYYLKDSGCRYFLDKTPRYYLIVKELRDIFPNAKLILLIRNPLAVLGSIINTWTKENWKNLKEYKHDLFDAIDVYIEALDRSEENVFVIYYDKLISNAEEGIRDISSYLGVEYEDNSLKYYEKNERWKLGDQENVYSKKGVDKKSDLSWQTGLGDLQYWRIFYDYINFIGKEKFEKLGYDFKESIGIIKDRMPHKSLDYINKNTTSLSFLLKDDSDELEISRMKNEIIGIKKKLYENENKISKIYTSAEWRVALIFQKLFKFIFPLGSLNRRAVFFVVRFFRDMYKVVVEQILLLIRYSERFKTREKRNININSKKIVYVGHSYHNKTKSTDFLLDYLRQFYEVEVISDDSWQGDAYPDLSFIDEDYLGVIFFQLLPPSHVLKSIKNDNIIHFPMYDQSGRAGYDYWRKYRDLKVVNFSKTLHRKLERWGFETMYLQYFPKPLEFSLGKKDGVFFWQRLTKININLFEKLFRANEFKLHIHKSIDPVHRFVQPSKKQEDKYDISYSKWFDTREEMQDVIKQKSIYIAPREFEGIGMSFLEAMAMGKAVVAVDNPTMNEYIEHGKTGYLFDLKNPKKIDFSNIEKVQKNTYDYMKAGYEKWESEKHRIIDFIEKE